MIDQNLLRTHLDEVANALKIKRNFILDVEQVKALEEKRKVLQVKTETLQAERNARSKNIGAAKARGEDISALLAEVDNMGNELNEAKKALDEVQVQIKELLLNVPNLPAEEVPLGKDDSENLEVTRWGEPRQFDFEPKAHWDIGEELDILDFNRAVKMSGARFTVYKGLGARLERALINFMVDLHVDKQGYTEMMTPYMVTRETLTGTGQLPKFAEDMYHVENTEYFLIPTAEVTLTNYHSGEILSEDELPKYYTAFTACFRAEAGSAGRDTRGLIRQHQFNKVEMVKLSKPEDSWNELEKLTDNAEEVLRLLELPFRVITLCTGDIGFGSAKTYDVEVWMPAQNKYREISSCSNMTDFQARRANIKFRRGPKGKPEFVHTLNGSGLAVGRTVAAILENNQQPDGSVVIPKVLVPYMGGVEKITPAK